MFWKLISELVVNDNCKLEIVVGSEHTVRFGWITNANPTLLKPVNNRLVTLRAGEFDVPLMWEGLFGFTE